MAKGPMSVSMYTPLTDHLFFIRKIFQWCILGGWVWEYRTLNSCRATPTAFKTRLFVPARPLFLYASVCCEATALEIVIIPTVCSVRFKHWGLLGRGRKAERLTREGKLRADWSTEKLKRMMMRTKVRKTEIKHRREWGWGSQSNNSS